MALNALPAHLGTGRDDAETERRRQEQTAALRRPSDGWAAKPPNAKVPITHVYLKFETILPAANTLQRTADTSHAEHPPPPPPPPALARFANPQNWPRHRKRRLLALSCSATFLTAYTAGAYSPSSSLMASHFSTSQTAALAGITTFCVGFALAPMFLAPISELHGRYPVFVASGLVFVLFQVVCGVAANLPVMLLARLLVGMGGSVFSTMVGGVIADMYDARGRNTPMALFSGSVLAGTGAGPLVAAVLTERKGGLGGGAWRWIFWHQAIAGGVLMAALVLFFQESRGSVLLSRKAKALNQWYDELEAAGYFGVWREAVVATSEQPNAETTLSWPGSAATAGLDEEKALAAARVESQDSEPGDHLERIRWRVLEDEERSSIGKMISNSVCRPFHLLVTEPVVFFFSLWVAFAWAVLYLTFSSIFAVFGRVYQFNVEQSGRVFIAMIVGSGLATASGVFQDHLLRYPAWQPRAPSPSPFWCAMRRGFPTDVTESRLYFSCFTSTLLPIGLFVFGFTARPDIHWIVPTVAVGLATMGIYSVYLATFNYLADVYHKYASSALAAQSFCRNILGGIFPILSGALFLRLGEARGGALLGAIGTLLTLVPWVLIFFGERIRKRSEFAMVSAPRLPMASRVGRG